MNAATAILSENGRLRTLMRQVLSLSPEDTEELARIQAEIVATPKSQDRRGAYLGFKDPKVVKAALATRSAKTAAFYAQHGAYLRKVRDSSPSLMRMAELLDGAGMATPRGGQWSNGSIRNMLSDLPQK